MEVGWEVSRLSYEEKNMKRKAIGILILALLTLGIYLMGFYRAREQFREAAKEVQIDTVFRYDTIRIDKPGEIRSFKSSIPLILPLSDTIRLRDTVYLVLNRQIKEYRDSLFYARVSGYEPSLDYIEVYPKTVVISKTETTTLEPSPWHVSLDMGLDYSRMEAKYISPNIGAEIGYKRLSITAELGVDLKTHDMMSMESHPYWKVGVKYNLFRR